MRFAVVSDLHLDTHKPKIAARIIEQLADMLLLEEVDWILFPGDLTTNGLCYDEKRRKLWRELMEPIAHRTIFVPGNHDFYGMTIPEFWKIVHDIGFAYNLNNETIEVDGITIYGGTLWFEKPAYEIAGWCDYEWIKGPRDDIYMAAAEFRVNMPDAVDIVLTHHLPTVRSQHHRFMGERTNCFFLNDCEELIRVVKPKYWVHGHTHDKYHYQFNQYTRIICNPLGYPSNDTGRYQVEVIEVE